jgi:hypothetical protein
MLHREMRAEPAYRMRTNFRMADIHHSIGTQLANRSLVKVFFQAEGLRK